MNTLHQPKFRNFAALTALFVCLLSATPTFAKPHLDAITVYTIRNYSPDGKPLGEWSSRSEPKVNGICVSWTGPAFGEAYTVCGGVTHVVRKQEPLLHHQGAQTP